MPDPFAKLHDRLMAKFAEPATIRGGATVVSMEHGVAVTGEYGEVTAYRSVATLPKGAGPKVGDTLIVGMASYVIDGIDADNGYVVRCVLR